MKFALTKPLRIAGIVLIAILLAGSGTAAGIALSPKKIKDGDFVAPKSRENLCYNFSDQDLILPGTCGNGTFFYSLDKNEWSTNVPIGNEMGEYTVSWYIQGSGKYKDYGSKENPYSLVSTIGKGNLRDDQVIAPTEKGIEEHKNNTIVNPGKTLIGTMLYSLDKENWSSSVPTYETVGTYTVYWYIQGDECFNDYASKENPKEITVNLAKKSLTIDQVDLPVALTLKPTGSAQRVFNPGLSYEQNVVFWYSSDGGQTWVKEYKTTYTEEGEYELLWYCTGNDNFYGIGSQQNPMKLTGSISSKNLLVYEDILPPSAAFNTVYTGKPIVLIEKPELFVDETKVGDFYYSIDGINYSKELPTATECGMYTVYWYLTKGTYYNGLGSEEQPIEIPWIEIYQEE